MGKDVIAAYNQAPIKEERPINFNTYRLASLQKRQQEILGELKTVSLQIEICNTLRKHLDTENIEICLHQISTLTNYFTQLQNYLRPFLSQQR